ncbi:helix-turn-helix transcriptional regulator [Propioniferax innocua]|uniref:helix-turn-helix transcriptional regulator n=1 Tax=Propioniferax innocua TaxID=1753 RepID=UPI001476C3F8|nr:LuxR family transcriptional regulator [Propioniferax innocua]
MSREQSLLRFEELTWLRDRMHDRNEHGRSAVVVASPDTGLTALLQAHAATVEPAAYLGCPRNGNDDVRFWIHRGGGELESLSIPWDQALESVDRLVAADLKLLCIDDVANLAAPQRDELFADIDRWTMQGTATHVGLVATGEAWVKDLTSRAEGAVLDLGPLPIVDLAQFLVASERLEEEVAGAVAEVSHGFPGIARRICRDLSRSKRFGIDMTRSWVLSRGEGVLRDYVQQYVPPCGEAWRLLVLSVFLQPHVRFEDVRRATGLGYTMTAEVRAAEDFAWVPCAQDVNDVLARALVSDVPIEAREQVGRELEILTERFSLPPIKRLANLGILGLSDAHLAAAKTIAEDAANNGDTETLGAVGDQVMRTAANLRQVRWAQQLRLMSWQGRDWNGLIEAATVRSETTTAMDWTGLSPLFALENPGVAYKLMDVGGNGARHVAQQQGPLWMALVANEAVGDGFSAREWLRRNRCRRNECEMFLARLLIRAWTGGAAHASLRRVEARMRSQTIVADMGADTAFILALAHLALGDAAALSLWARVGAVSARDDRIVDAAFGDLLLAQSRVRQDAPEAACELAESARSQFAAIRAVNLERLAHYTVLHAALEAASTDMEHAAPAIDDPTMHPVIEAYGCYIAGRIHDAAGRSDEAVEHLFRAGKTLQRSKLHNPTLIPWRQELVQIYRKAGESKLAHLIDAERDRALARWNDRNPIPDLALRQTSESVDDLASRVSQAEARVVELALQGKTNIQIAQTLIISKRTVDTHLSNVYKKLGLSGRAQLHETFPMGWPMQGAEPIVRIV